MYDTVSYIDVRKGTVWHVEVYYVRLSLEISSLEGLVDPRGRSSLEVSRDHFLAFETEPYKSVICRNSLFLIDRWLLTESL